MSSALSSSQRSAEPAFDLAYSLEDFATSPNMDSQFFYRRTEQAMLDEGSGPGLRTLDVACGVGRLAAGASERGGQGWGLEPSREMIGVSRWVFPAERIVMVRGIAEVLPFRDATFDRVVCQGSLDHFVDPHAFMAEAARITRPDGRVVIALANYESLSCRIGRLSERVTHDLLRFPRPPFRRYWEIPYDHYHKGDLPFVRRLGGRSLRLDRCYGVSLLWLTYTWGVWLSWFPSRVAERMTAALDRIAQRAPGLADMIVSVWRPRQTSS